MSDTVFKRKKFSIFVIWDIEWYKKERNVLLFSLTNNPNDTKIRYLKKKLWRTWCFCVCWNIHWKQFDKRLFETLKLSNKSSGEIDSKQSEDNSIEQVPEEHFRLTFKVLIQISIDKDYRICISFHFCVRVQFDSHMIHEIQLVCK